MKLGFAGAGMIAQAVLKDLAPLGRFTVNAICATPGSEDKLKALSAEFGIGAWYTDYDQMLMDPEVDTVYVGVPNHLHFEFCRKALLAGRHVICEKPFTSNLREAEILAALAEERKLVIVEAVTTRYLPNVLQAKEDLKKLGNIRIVSMNYSQYSSRYDAFKAGQVLPAFNPAMSGGALMDLNIYNINFAVVLFGAPKSVDYRANVVKGIDTSGVLTMDYGDFQCVSIAAKDCKAPVFSSIQGDEGCLCTDSSLNLMTRYQILLNKNDGSRQMKADSAVYLDYNGDRTRIDYEFTAFADMIDSLDFSEAGRMMEITLTTMRIQTEARRKAGVVFAADAQA